MSIKSREEGNIGVDEDISSLSKDERIFVASQWKLMWWKFRKHKGAMVGGIILIVFYLLASFCEFFSPYEPRNSFRKYLNAPVQRIRFIDDEGFHFRPFVYGLRGKRDQKTRRMNYKLNEFEQYPIHFFVRGDEYKLWGLFKSDLHLFGVGEDGILFLFGTDSMGRDILSRSFYGTRVSLSIGLIGVFLSFLLGLLLGGVSGYAGGTIDNVIMRIVDLLVSIPTLPLWMALAAAVPMNWPPLRIYFMILVVLSIFGWGGLARVVRGKFLSLREEDFAVSARLVGSGEGRVIFRHLLPSFFSHIIVSITLSIPAMILGETALSFLGLGLRAPVISWGVMLQEAQNVRTLDLYPWRLLPSIFVVVAVLAFNFVGDGLRDAADPYA